MSLISITFFVFFIILFALYYGCMREKQWLLLLVGSLVFYAFASPIYLIFLLFSSVTVFLAAKGIRMEGSHPKIIFSFTVSLNLLILIIVKYTSMIFGSFGIDLSGTRFILPLGISYYTFIVIGYLTDVHIELIEPESSFLRFLTFVSYFPHITQGPINRYEDISGQLFAKHTVDAQRIKRGLYRIICGLAKKLIIAERLAVYVNRVYASPKSYDGLTLLAATFFYAIQIYCDFSGYMDMVLGLSGVLGIDMAENFNLPYFSQSIPEFWRRWHITLGSFFKDYLYYPVLRSAPFKKLTKSMKKSKIKFSKSFIRTLPTVLALLITWASTGIWHGASWHYGFWGLYHGVIIIMSMLLSGTFNKINNIMHVREESVAVRVLRIIRTFILVDIGYVFFRASSVKEAFEIFAGIISRLSMSPAAIKNVILPFTEDNTAVSYALVVLTAIAVLFVCELKQYISSEKASGSVSESDNKESTLKYVFAGVMAVCIILFGIFGQSSFIYMMY